MAQFTDVMRQARRMCKAHEDCKSCPMWDTTKYFCRTGPICCSDDGETESIVMQWAQEHTEPVYPTWDEWQNSVFPDAEIDITPCTFGSRDRFKCEDKTCAECMEHQIPADIAEKLGIKPKED